MLDFYPEKTYIFLMYLSSVKRLIVIHFAALVVWGVPTEARAEYKGADTSLITGSLKKELAKLVSQLKKLPKNTREAFFAEELGLPYMPTGASAVHSSQYYGTSTDRGAIYISTSGRERDWTSDFKAVPWSKWEACKLQCRSLGREAVLGSFSKEVTRLIHATMKAYMKAMPPVLKDAWLSEKTGLLYGRDGKNPYGEDVTIFSRSGVRATCRDVNSKYAYFTDSQGNEHNLYAVWVSLERQWRQRWRDLHLCAYLVGDDEALGLFSKDIEALKASRSAVGTPDPVDVSPSSTPTDTDSATASSISSSSTTSSVAGAKDAASDLWAQLSPEEREQYLAEYFNLYFWANEYTDPYNVKRRWVNPRGQYVGTDNQIHDYQNRFDIYKDYWHRKLPETQAYYALRDWLGRQNSESILAENRKVVEQLAANNARYVFVSLPTELRDALLADAAGLVYSKNDPKSSPFSSNVYTTNMGKIVRCRSFTDSLAYYVDSNEHSHAWTELSPYKDAHEYRWALLHCCMQLLGRQKFLALFPEEVSKLRSAFSAVTGRKVPLVPADDAKTSSPPDTAMGSRSL